MAGAEQRIADLEQQVGELAAEVSDLRAQAFVIRSLEELAARRAGIRPPAVVAPSRRPRHLSLVGSGSS